MEQTLKLRAFQKTDIPQLKQWLAIPRVAAWYPVPEDWIYEVEHQAEEYPWLHHRIAEWDGREIGFCQYYAYHNSGEDWHGTTPLEGTYSIDYMIGENDAVGKGLGKRMIALLLREVWRNRDAVRVIVQPEPENTTSCGVLRSLGFVFDERNQVYLLERKSLSPHSITEKDNNSYVF